MLNPSNALTAIRLALIPVLWFLAWRDMNMWFVVLFLLAGSTDILDGWIARTRGIDSERGAWFDSLADNLLGLSSLGWLWLFIEPFIRTHWIPIVAAVGLKALSFMIGYLKYRQIVGYHLLTDKLSGVVYFAFVAHAVWFGPSLAFYLLTAGISILSSLEEIVATLRFDRMRSDVLTVLTSPPA